jgi:RNA polymerase sigma-70 factor (family 1)
MPETLPHRSLTDQELTALLQNGDQLAFTEIYNRYWEILFKHARRMLHEDDEAQDVVQDIFAVLWTNRATLNLRSSLSSYLYSAVRNKIINLINHDKIKNNYLSSLERFIDHGSSITDQLILEKELAQSIEREVSSLPEKMREAFELSRKSSLSYKEISEKMHISENTVKKHISNAIRILRSRLDVIIFLFILLIAD